MKKRILSALLATLTAVSACAQAPSLPENPDNAVVYNKEDGARLVGTWAVPEKDSPKAVVLLVTGSGLQDRDETLMDHRPFRAISDRLVKEGYGVLRLDDRGFGKSTGDAVNATTTTLTGDMASALEWLDSVAPGTPKGIVGHSEGGLKAINLAADNRCDFIVTLGAPGMPGDSITLTQARAVTEAMAGRYEAEPLQKQLLSIAKSDLPTEEAKAKMMELMMAQLGAQAYLPGVKKQIEGQVDMALIPWSREWFRTDPTEAIKKVSVPWLALNGAKDYQVLPVNLEIIGQLNPKAECVLLPDLNHLFLECSTGLPQEYVSLKGDISERTLDEIVRFLSSIRN